MIQLLRPLVIFDLETTGTNIVYDRIIEFGFVKIFPGKTPHIEANFRINPLRHIPEESTKIHGITDEDVRHCLPFERIAPDIKKIFENSDVGGYNSNNFDVPMLVEHFLRLKIEVFNEHTRFIDVQAIFKKKEERTLKAAVKYFLGEDFEDAHNAERDAVMTMKVLQAQVEKYPDIGNDVIKLAEFSQYENSRRVDYAGKLIFNDKGQVCYNIGSVKGTPVEDDPSFGEWMLSKDFPLDTQRRLIKIFEEMNGLEKEPELEYEQEEKLFDIDELPAFEPKEIKEEDLGDNDGLPF